MSRKIIHIDMDAFFAAVEQRDNPALKGRPVIVGGQPNSRGVVATCSYEARKFGIHSAMPAARAWQLCPQGIFVKPRIAAYREVSQQIHQVFQQYTDLIEPLSLDEAYLDVSAVDRCSGSASLMAKEIRQQIFDVTQLTASAGISYNKFLAKIASDINKPNGQFLIKPEDGEAFVQQLPIGKFFGIGKVTEAKMHALGIQTGADLKQWPKEKLSQYFGKSGVYYYSIVRGIDERPVTSHRMRKSLGAETTFQTDIHDVEIMQQHLFQLAEQVVSGLQKKQLAGHTLTIKVKYADFQQITRSITVDELLYDVKKIICLIPLLLNKTEVDRRPVRLLGVTVSSLSRDIETGHDVQPGLFDQI